MYWKKWLKMIGRLGENSGHIIIADKNTTGDGIVASLAVLAAMAQHKLSLK